MKKSPKPIASLNGSQYSPEVLADRNRVFQKPFDPESSDYDYAMAELAGMLPDSRKGENFGHMGSVTSVTPEIYEKYKKYGLPAGESYIVLKGAKHPTHNYLIEGEAERGFEVKKFGDRYFSVPKKNNENQKVSESILGFPKREPYESELNFFKQRPEVAGMATEDNAIILNPFSKLSDQEKQSVAKNEAIRLWLKKNNVQPQFNLTPEQFKFFRNTEYGQSKDATPLKQTIIARILTGDPSVGNVTPMQKQWADWVMSRISKESQQQAE